MARLCLILLLAAAGSAWASAQSPIAGDSRALLRKNQGLLVFLVDRTVELADADNHLARATACRQAAAELARELKRAAEADDPDRVAEVGEYLALSVSHGLTPVLADARNKVPAGSVKELSDLHQAAAAETAAAEAGIPHVGRVGQSELVRAARAKLADAQAKLAAAGR